MKRKIFIVVTSALIVMQFFRIDKTTPDSAYTSDFFTVHQAPEKTENLVKKVCYDCHSHETTYPWYSNIAPISWWLQHHVKEAREHLNFSTWGGYTAKKANHKLEECLEEVKEGEMPLFSYKLMHPDARISREAREELANWFKSLYVEEENESD